MTKIIVAAVMCFLENQSMTFGPNGARNICTYRCGAEVVQMSLPASQMCPMTTRY